jgi:hypothetical protein
MNFNFFKKEPTIEFFSVIPEIAHLAPIQPLIKFKSNLIINSTKNLSQVKKKPEFEMQSNLHTAKCPGIINKSKLGWVMTTWQDLVIETYGDGVKFTWESPVDQRQMKNGDLVGEMLSFHPEHQYSNFVETDSNTLKLVLKIQTPWRCIVPKGYYLHEGPLPYTDEKRFTTVEGFFSRESGVSNLNVQLLWHVPNGKTLIKAGTPIAHYMLVPKNQPKLVVMEASEKQLKAYKLSLAEVSRKYISKKGETACIFAKYFGDK